MNRFLMGVVAVLSFSACMLALSARAGATASSPQQAGAAQQPNAMEPMDAKAFQGTIVQEKGKLVLKDAATKAVYQLDDQEKAKQFEGKQVKVTGKVDHDTKLIHVENIEAGS